MEVDLEDTLSRQDPAEVEIEKVYTSEKRLVYAWKVHVGHERKLLKLRRQRRPTNVS